MNNDFFCNNCGKQGHSFHQCKMPITSNGVIAFRIVPYTNEIQFLMIRRKDTLGYMDFMRGKFPVFQKQYILNMLFQMTIEERNKLRQRTFSFLNNEIKDVSFQYKEKIQVLMKGVEANITENIENESYDLLSLLDEADQTVIWHEPEWGFPKGRRNTQEKDYECALREFSEETGYNVSILNNIRNIIPFEEIFIGSNYKVYRHKYYLMNISYKNSLTVKTFQKSEVSGMEWKNFNECMSSIRSYNLEKKQMLGNVYNCLTHSLFCSIKDNINDNDIN
jgi:ADP-ribose pyrophosphatase YjhB (NUDIX family)